MYTRIDGCKIIDNVYVDYLTTMELVLEGSLLDYYIHIFSNYVSVFFVYCGVPRSILSEFPHILVSITKSEGSWYFPFSLSPTYVSFSQEIRKEERARIERMMSIFFKRFPIIGLGKTNVF